MNIANIVPKEVKLFEQVFVMESDGVAGRIRNQGSVDACQHDIVTLLEGGVDAFRRRRDRYGYP
mgnify:CR=1 FL=1